MSTWIEVKPEDINVNLEDESVDILYSTDSNGNNYITVPLEVLVAKIEKSTDAVIETAAMELFNKEK